MAERESLDAIMKSINKDWGGDCIRRGVSEYDYKRIPFTSPRLNYISFGGIPMGKLIEFYGEEHGGKTTTALDIVANYQQMDDAKSVLYVDAENTLDTVWATKLGVDVDEMLIMNPTTQGAETIFEQVLKLIGTNEVGLVIIDSLGVMMSNQAYEKTVEEKTYGGIAMALTNFSKKAEAYCHKHNCTIIGINQMRADMNSMYGGKTTTGGLAWKHNVAARFEFRKGDYFDSKYGKLPRGAEHPMGNKVEVAMAKNKTCPPTRRTGFYTLRYDIGIDYLYDLTEVCIKYGAIEKSGSWFVIKQIDMVYDSERDEDVPTILDGEVAKLQGQYAVYDYLSDESNMGVLKSLEDYIDEHIKRD